MSFENTLRGEGTISLFDQEYTVKLNMNAFRMLTQRFEVPLQKLDEFMENNEIEAVAALGYCGVRAGEASKGNKFDMGYEEFCGVFLDDIENVNVVTGLITGATTGEEEGGESGNE